MIDKIVRSIAPKEMDTIVEIGPGRGAITFPLLTSGCQLEAVEIDKDLIPGLYETCPLPEKFHLHNADALTFDFSVIAAQFRLVGNLPYNISTPLLFHLMNFTSQISDIHVMLQREVVDRIVAKPHNKTYGRLSVMLQYYCDVERLFLIPPGVFDPVPKIDSALLRLIPKKNRPLNVNQEKYLEELVKLAFGQRRKTLRNNLKTIISTEQWASMSIDSQQRAENLSVEDFVRLTRLLAESVSVEEVGGGSERRTGVYTPVHEDLSTEPTNKFPKEIGLCKKSTKEIEKNGDLCNW